MKLTLLAVAGAVAAAAVGARAEADVPHDICVNRGFGVPTRPGPPAWASWPGASTSVDTTLDDPRWDFGGAQSFATGRPTPTGAPTATMHVREVWAPDSTGQEYLYLSLVSDLHPNSTTPRDIFVAFHRANPGLNPPDTGVFGYMFQFHLTPSGTEVATPLKYCGSLGKPECTDGDASSVGDWWRVFRDFNNPTTLTCAGGAAESGEQFKQWNGTDPAHLKDYLFFPPELAWLDGAVHAWKDGGNKWAIQIRLKVATTTSAASPALISDGIEKGSTLWYEATETLATPNASIAKFPAPGGGRTGVSGSICVGPGGSVSDSVLHPDLTDATKYAKFTDLGADPGDCDTGLKIGDIGSLFNTGPPYDGVTPLNGLKAVDGSNTLRANTLIAKVLNTSSAPITGTVQARFRLANWGSGPIGSDTGQFSDIRGGSAVCLPSGGPPCTPQMLAAGSETAIHFDWTIGTDPVMGRGELCSYGLTPPGGSCVIGNGSNGCLVGQTKSTISPDPVTGSPPTCVPLHNPHECMFVELTSPKSDLTFVQASVYNNMNFAEMSTVAREALIDARNLPRSPGQPYQDIYFMVVPRNLPSSVPAGTTTTNLIQAAAVTRAFTLSRPYLADIARLQKDDPAGLQQIIDRLSKQRPGQNPPVIFAAGARAKAGGDERINQIVSAMRVMPNENWERSGKLVGLAGYSSQSDHPNDELVHNAVSTLGAEEAAQVVPTLEVYPFYKAPNEAVYQPMTSFALFLSHEDTLGGVRYEVDGATRVAENVYHVTIPVGNARKIQVRAQALTGNEPPLPVGNPAWPCAGGCVACGGANRNCGLVATIGNTTPGLLAGVFVIRRRRKKSKAAEAA